MSEINVYEWEDIRKYFPPERIARIRAEILELRKSGKYTDEELWKMYGMSERTFYDLVARGKEGSTAEDLKDKPSKPKNPYRKLTDEDKAEIINLRLDDTNRIESSKLAFVESMEKTNRVLKPEKLQRLLDLMDKAIKGVRRIAALFNRKRENEKKLRSHKKIMGSSHSYCCWTNRNTEDCCGSQTSSSSTRTIKLVQYGLYST